jgi:hypothetical protein
LTPTQTKLFDGVPKEDGTTVSLAPVDQRRCIVGRDELIKARFEPGYPLGWLKKWDYDSDCADPAKCAQARYTRLLYYISCSPLWLLFRDGPHEQKLFCAACHSHAAELAVAGRKKLWEDLPKFFDLPPWSELSNDP